MCLFWTKYFNYSQGWVSTYFCLCVCLRCRYIILVLYLRYVYGYFIIYLSTMIWLCIHRSSTLQLHFSWVIYTIMTGICTPLSLTLLFFPLSLSLSLSLCHCLCLSLFSLVSRRQQWKKTEEERIANRPDPSIPPGHTLMSQQERRHTLGVLSQRQYTLMLYTNFVHVDMYCM